MIPHVHPGLSSACLLQKGCRTFGICLNPFDSEFLPELWMKVTSTKPPRGWDFWTKLASKKSWFHGFVLTPLWAKKMLISTSWGRRNQPRSLRAFWKNRLPHSIYLLVCFEVRVFSPQKKWVEHLTSLGALFQSHESYKDYQLGYLKQEGFKVLNDMLHHILGTR